MATVTTPRFDDSGYLIKEKSDEFQSKLSMKIKKLNGLDDNELIERINKIKQENNDIHRENLLFSRYLIRINTPEIIETYDEYEHEDNLLQEIFDQIQSPDITRRYSLKKHAYTPKKGTPGWTKVSINFNKNQYTSPTKLIDRERLYIAAYEFDQGRLDSLRLKANGISTLDDLDMLLRTTESDEITQETLNFELENRVDKYRATIGEAQFNSPYLKVPAELVISRINKRIHSRISDIGLLRVNSTRLHYRINDINEKIRALDDLVDKMDEIDILLINTRRINNTEIFDKVDRKFKKVKSTRYPLFKRLQELKKYLTQLEKNIFDMKHKCEFLQSHYERTIIEINSIQEECEKILNENSFLKNRMDDIIQVPTISNYVHIMKQMKYLQHGIDIWTQRVNIADTVLLQLEQQKKPPSILPPLKTTTHDRSMKSLNDKSSNPFQFSDFKLNNVN